MDIEHFVMAFDLPFYDVAFGRRETDIYIYIYSNQKGNRINRHTMLLTKQLEDEARVPISTGCLLVWYCLQG